MNPDVLKMRSFRFAAPAEGRCDLLVIAGEHSGDEQSARMVSDALKINPDLKICAFGGEKLSECRGAASLRHDEFFCCGSR